MPVDGLCRQAVRFESRCLHRSQTYFLTLARLVCPPPAAANCSSTAQLRTLIEPPTEPRQSLARRGGGGLAIVTAIWM